MSVKTWARRKVVQIALKQIKNELRQDAYAKEFLSAYYQGDTLFNCVYAIIKKTPDVKDDQVMAKTKSIMENTDKIASAIHASAMDRKLKDVVQMLHSAKFPKSVVESGVPESVGALLKYLLED